MHDCSLDARRLSSEHSKVPLVLGAGPVARLLTDAYLHIRPSIREVLSRNHTPSKLEAACAALGARNIRARIVDDLNATVARAGIITAATSTSTPVIRGECVRPGTHVDLISGYLPDMQEADFDVFRGARIFVDDRQNAAPSSNIQIPMLAGVIQESGIEGDLFNLCRLPAIHRSAADRTVYKNADGAHQDLIVGQYVVAQL